MKDLHLFFFADKGPNVVAGVRGAIRSCKVAEPIFQKKLNCIVHILHKCLKRANDEEKKQSHASQQTSQTLEDHPGDWQPELLDLLKKFRDQTVQAIQHIVINQCLNQANKKKKFHSRV